MRLLLILFLLVLPLGAQEPDDNLGIVTTSPIPDKPRWPAAVRGVSFRLEALRFLRNNTADFSFRRGTGEGAAFTPQGPAVTMTINLRDTCSGQPCVTFTLDGVTKRYVSRSDQRRLRRAAREVFAQWSEILPEFFQPDRMVVP